MVLKIIDTSIAIRWFIEEEGREKALEVLAHILEKPLGFAVPELFFYELIHVFQKQIPRPNQTQKELFQTIFQFGWSRFPLASDMVPKIMEYQALGLSGYDSSYVALAYHLKGKWLTFDHKAHTKIRSLHLSECLV